MFYLIDCDLFIGHAGLADILPVGWSKILTKHYGGDSHDWYLACTTLDKDWDSYWWNPAEDFSLTRWHKTREKLFFKWFDIVDREIPQIDDSWENQLAILELEVGRHCEQALLRKDTLQRVHQASHEVGFLSAKTSASLVRGMLDMAGFEFASVIGPAEIGQLGLNGTPFQIVSGLIYPDQDCAGYVSQSTPVDWPVVEPRSWLASLSPPR